MNPTNPSLIILAAPASVRPDVERRQRLAELVLTTTEPPATVRLDGQEMSVPVVRAPLDLLVLNARNHRLQAHLEGHPEADLVRREPESARAQAVLAEILGGQNQFREFARNLDREKQRDPGHVTPGGILINANRRKVAALFLGWSELKVAVLPEASNDSLFDLELALQVRPDYKLPYTFTNEILIIHELLNRNVPQAEVARLMGYNGEGRNGQGIDRVQAGVRKLNLLRQVQALSNSSLPLTYFDTKKQAIDELDDECEELLRRTSDPAQVRQLRDTRLLGLLIGFDYRRLREVRTDFAERHLPEVLQQQEWGDCTRLFQQEEAVVAVEPDALPLPGLDILQPPAGSSPVPHSPALDTTAALARVARVMAKVQAEEDPGDVVVVEPVADLPGLTWQDIQDQLHPAFNRAIKDSKIDRKANGDLRQPIKRLEDAQHNLELVLGRRAEFLGRDEFDQERFAGLVAEIRSQVEQLEACVESPAGLAIE